MSSSHYLGFDIGGTHARCALIVQENEQFKILSSQKHSIRGAQTPADVAQLIRYVVEKLPADSGICGKDLSGIGIAIAGQIGVDGHIVINAPNLNWHHVDFYEAVHNAVADLAPDTPIEITNDLNAIVWGEYHFGAGHAVSDLLAVYVGTGIGAGLVSGKKLLAGANNVSGEIGHCKFPQFKGIQCGCGQTGCVEAYAGGKAIEYRILHDIQTGVVSRSDLDLSADELPTARCIEAGYKRGLKYAVDFWQDTAQVLGMLISNALAILNPGGLLLGGGVLQGCPELLALVIHNIMEMAPRASVENLQFIKPALHDDAGTLGAALLCLNT